MNLMTGGDLPFNGDIVTTAELLSHVHLLTSCNLI